MLTIGGGFAWSYTDTAWLGFFYTMRDGRVLLRHEMTWVGVTPEEAAPQIAKKIHALTLRSDGEPIARFSYISADPKMFPKNTKSRGETVAETFQRGGVPLTRGDEDRINGWSRVRSWLQPMLREDGTRTPSLVIHPDCGHILRTLPTLISDPKNADDIWESPDELPASGLRYYVMSRPMPTREQEVELPPGAIGHDLRKAREDARLGV
jgi:hypothetical protein